MDFLRDHLYETELAIQAGLGRYTWQSFNIQKYCESINVLLRKLSSIVSSINYIRVDFKKRIDEIPTYNLFEVIEPKSLLMHDDETNQEIEEKGSKNSDTNVITVGDTNSGKMGP